MQPWIIFETSRPEPFAMVLYYVPDARYVWGTGADYDQVKVDYPSVTHYQVFGMPPPK